MSANFTPTLGDVTELKPFRYWCQKVLPLVFDDTLSYYELLCKVVDYLNNTMADVNTLSTDVENLHTAYQELQGYVNNYFNNLDLQEEINSKLDAMAADGSLTTLISPLIPDLVSDWLDENIEPTTPAIDKSLSVLDAGAESKTTGMALGSLRSEINSLLEYEGIIKHAFKINPDLTAYATGTQGTYIHLISDETTPIVIPKNTKLAVLRFASSSIVQHYVNVYFLRNVNMTFTVVKKLSNVNVFNNAYLQINETFDEDVCIAVQNCEDYALKKNDNNSSAQTNMKPYTLGTSLDTAVGDVLTGGYQNHYYNLGIGIDIVLGKNFDSRIGNGSFMFTGKNITEELGYHANKGFTFSAMPAYCSIFNYTTYLFDSSVGHTSKPLQVRDENGRVINDFEITNIATMNNDTNLLLEFGKDGIFLRGLDKETFAADGISDDAYYVVCRIFTNFNSGIELKTKQVAWLESGEKVYTVGTGKDFDTFTEMCIALANDSSNKTVYIEPGTYDIYEEYGGDTYMENLDPTGKNWRDVCHVIPDNTRIIGKGKVIFTWNPSAAAVGSNEKAFLFSPINISGNCHLENIEVTGQNCRYIIHDETSGQAKWKNVKHTYKNVKATKTANSYNQDQVFGCGLGADGLYEFENCVFESFTDWIFTMHTTSMNATDKCIVRLTNTIIKKLNSTVTSTTLAVGLGNTNTSERDVQFNVDNSWVYGKIYRYAENNQAGAVNAFQVNNIGSNDITVQDASGLTNNKTDYKFNV